MNNGIFSMDTVTCDHVNITTTPRQKTSTNTLRSEASFNMAASVNSDELDSWTVVKAKKKSSRRSARSGLDFHQSAPLQPKVSGLATPTAVAHIRSEYERITAQINEQNLYSPIREWIVASAPRHTPVSRAICLGAGSFGGPLDGGEAIRRAHVQTCVFLAIVEILST